MSVQFGRWNFEDQPPVPDYIEKVSSTLAPYGPDSNESYSKAGLTILYRALHTTKESHHEKDPHVSSSGAVITWDGRLDNRAELTRDLRDVVTISSTDIEIVAAAYKKWSTSCLAKLIGDWAVSIWNPIQRSLVLAVDPIGTRHLYYSLDKDHVTWSTILDPLVRFADKTFVLCEEYIAGWFSMFPAVHLTPYVGIHAVPPSSFVLLRPGTHVVRKYWDFDPEKRIRYNTDAEYEEHFRTVFATAVQRRLRSDRPVLAELSGGMDSSAIVCMADIVIARGDAETPRLDTLSWYDGLDPALDERPFLTKVEEKRGRTGWHIDISELESTTATSQRSIVSDFESDRLAVTPTSSSSLSGLYQQYVTCMKSQGYRVTLSGIGGEEATGGGVPTPIPELQNLLARVRFVSLGRQLNAWAVKMRKPRLPLLREAVRGFFCHLPVGAPHSMEQSPPWFAPGFVRRNRTALDCYSFKVKLFGALPSFQNQLHELDHIRRFLADCPLYSEWLREMRFPYLDRDLLEFAYAIPREQLVRVGQRRSLMKRALFGIVPDDLLNRKPKASASHNSKQDTPAEWPSAAEIGQHTVSGSAGIIDPNRLLSALDKVRRKEQAPVRSLMRTLFLESWMRHLMRHGVLMKPTNRETTFLVVS